MLNHCLKLFVLTSSLVYGTAMAATLAPGVQQKLDNATFEVVLAKPEADPLTYEKPLPLELIPYRERTDKFRSIGTAFAIAANRFVSAAHVVMAGNGSQYGPLALRDAAGKVYRIDKVIKYSSSEDFAVFSLVEPPLVVPLQTRSKPPLNSPVFAVGNALGEGVVVRDGLYTSDTPEELDGRWQWLRFSAAASPGNSGGPLIDHNGKVIGVILRKSPNENLNFALGIGQVVDGSDRAARFDGRSSYRSIMMNAADSVSMKEEIDLPKTLDDFYAAAHQMGLDYAARIHADYVKNHENELFPKGNSEQLLGAVWAESFPKLIHLSDSGVWALVGDAPKRVALDKNGYLQEGNSNGIFFVRLKTPDDVPAPNLSGDSKQFMDLLLKGNPVSRPVGSDSVRVTSMGSAFEEFWYTDNYRRPWQVRSWFVPFNDSAMVTFAMPTPDGAVMIMEQIPASLREMSIKEIEWVSNFVYFSFTGTLLQWRAFLASAHSLTPAPSDPKIQMDYGRGLDIKTSRFQLVVPPSVLPINDESVMMLRYSFIRDGTSAVWDLGGVYLADGEQRQKWIGLLRRSKPSSSMPEEVTRLWDTMITAKHPWEGVPYVTGGRTDVGGMVNLKAMSTGKTIGYSITLNEDGTQLVPKMKKDFSLLERGITVYE